MATYKCSKCGMSVNATCAKCNEHLVDDSLSLENGSRVQISKSRYKILLYFYNDLLNECILKGSKKI